MILTRSGPSLRNAVDVPLALGSLRLRDTLHGAVMEERMGEDLAAASLEELAAAAYERGAAHVREEGPRIEVVADGAVVGAAWSVTNVRDLLASHLKGRIALKAKHPWARKDWQDPLELARALLAGDTEPPPAEADD
jgi:hypothetical protein